MPHDLAFAESARQAPVSILRLPMLPYSIGHEIILLSERNPLLFDRAEFDKLTPYVQRSAVIRAALVCYRTWAQNQKPERNLWLWGWMNRKADWALEIANFRNYREQGSNCPPGPTKESYEIANGLQNEEEGREFGGSSLARALDFCCSVHTSLGYESAYDVPMGLCNFLYFSKLEVDEKARIENTKEAQVRDEMAGHRAAIAKERETQCQP